MSAFDVLPRSTPAFYSPSHKWVHWITALIVISLIGVGLYMTDLPRSPFKGTVYGLHKSFGLVVLVLLFTRVLIKVRRGIPGPETSLTRFERIASMAVHHSLYLLLLIVPLAGFIMTSASYGPVSFFGLFDIPNFIPGGKTTSDFFRPVHQWSAYVLAALILAHVGAAFFHLVYHRDAVFWRMWPR